MESPSLPVLRSRSRSKTPFIGRSSVDRDDGEVIKSGRRTPSKRNTPVKQLNPTQEKKKDATIDEESEDDVELVYTSPPAHRTRNALKTHTQSTPIIKTSDYSSDEISPDTFGEKRSNYQYESVSTTTRTVSTLLGESAGRTSLTDIGVSPIAHGFHNYSYAYPGNGESSHRNQSRATLSPAPSELSTASSFAEQALADVTRIADANDSQDHLPYRLYKAAGEYWNKYPKTDYTYSLQSKDRVELAPGQVAMPNMSRRSLQAFRTNGPNTEEDHVDHYALLKSQRWQTQSIRRRLAQGYDSSDDDYTRANTANQYKAGQESWLVTRFLLAIWTRVVTTVTSITDTVLGRERERYPYTPRYVAHHRDGAGYLRKTGSILAAPLLWSYYAVHSLVTMVTTTTESSSTYGLPHAPQQNKSRWCLWLLPLLLLAALYAGFYTYENFDDITIPECPDFHDYLPDLGSLSKNLEYPKTDAVQNVRKDTEKLIDRTATPIVIQDPELLERLAALEDRLALVTQKLDEFKMDMSQTDHSERVKEWSQNMFVTKEELKMFSLGLEERLKNTQGEKPEFSEEHIRNVIQEVLLVYEKEQTAIFMSRFREHIKEVNVTVIEKDFDAEALRRIVREMLMVYDADKTGVIDFALESAGGQVVSTRCTELYQIRTKQYSVLGVPLWWSSSSPRDAIAPGAAPGECWAFQGFPGYLVIRTYAIINVTGFSVEHMPKMLAVDGKIESAPRNFSVYGLREELDQEPHHFGDYMYDENATSIQFFAVKNPNWVDIDGEKYPVAYDLIQLQIETNYGNPTFTCLYRFRVHGNPVGDIKLATDKVLKDLDDS